MNKIKYIKQILQDINVSQNHLSLALAFIDTLSAKDTCRLLDPSFNQSPYLRRKILKKMASDIGECYEKCHEELISKLLSQIQMKSFSKRTSCAYAIHYLLPYIPHKNQKNIISSFLFSPYSSIRERAFKILYRNWEKIYVKDILDVWDKYHTDSCAKIIIKHFPISVLLNRARDLFTFSTSWRQRSLLLKIINSDKKLVKELTIDDPITYTYVLAKSGKKISSLRAWEIAQKYREDDKIGLLLWCFGQMGLWKTLVKFKETYLDK